MKILLVEDNENIASALEYSLKQNKYDVDIAYSVKSAQNRIKYNTYNLMILDVSLPDGNGFELYKLVSEKDKIKTIFLTALDDEENVVKGLELGAEDYMTKPFSTRELMARIKKILGDGKQTVKIKDIVYDIDKMTIIKNNKEIEFTPLEKKILYLLFTNRNKVITRENIIEKIWDWTGNDVNDNTISVYMKRIRERLGPNIIKTIKGIGYRVDDEK